MSDVPAEGGPHPDAARAAATPPGARLKQITETVRDIIALAKDGAVVLCLAAIVIFPTATRNYLLTIGLTTLPSPIGPISLARAQVKDSAEALTSLETARRALPAGSDAAGAVDNAIKAIQTTAVKAQEVLAAIQPSTLPTTGWLYLGTVNPQRTAWNPTSDPRAVRTIQEEYASLQQDAEVRLRIDVNLREDHPGPNGALPRVIGVVRAGQAVRILALDSSREVTRDEPGGPGYRIFASVTIPPREP